MNIISEEPKTSENLTSVDDALLGLRLHVLSSLGELKTKSWSTLREWQIVKSLSFLRTNA